MFSDFIKIVPSTHGTAILPLGKEILIRSALQSSKH